MEDDQQYCLRWNNHQTTLIQNFDTLLESGTLVDCTLAAEGKYLKAHKVVLSACSPYFEGLLSEHYDKHPVFILKDVKFKELKAMMDYMYRGEVNISQDQLTHLLKAAESLQIKGLSDSRTGGASGGGGNTTTTKSEAASATTTRSAKTTTSSAAVAAAAATAAADIPHHSTTTSSSGLTIEKNNKVPRQNQQQVSVIDVPEDSASPRLRSREGSMSPSRKRKRARRRSQGQEASGDVSMDNHDASNSSDAVQVAAAATGSVAVAPVVVGGAQVEDRSQADPNETSGAGGRSALMQQLTRANDEMHQGAVEKPELNDELIQPKSEIQYVDDNSSLDRSPNPNLDDEMNALSEVDRDNSQPGTSHDPAHGVTWHVAGERSNASVMGAGGAAGGQDEVFLAAHEAANAQRDSQDHYLPFLAGSTSMLTVITDTVHELESRTLCNWDWNQVDYLSNLVNDMEDMGQSMEKNIIKTFLKVLLDRTKSLANSRVSKNELRPKIVELPKHYLEKGSKKVELFPNFYISPSEDVRIKTRMEATHSKDWKKYTDIVLTEIYGENLKWLTAEGKRGTQGIYVSLRQGLFKFAIECESTLEKKKFNKHINKLCDNRKSSLKRKGIVDPLALS